MTTGKDISIVIPVRNEEEYIHKCIDSLINQNYPHEKYEIIVVDGMSTDNTRQILKNYQLQYQNLIKFLDNPKITQVVGRNIGIKNAEGGIVIKFDGHSYAHPQFLTNITNEFSKCDKDVVVIGANILTAPDESTIGDAIGKVQMSILGGGDSSFRISKTNKFVNSPGFPAYRKEVFTEIGLFDEIFDIGEDIDLNWRIKTAGKKIMLCGSAIVYYYRRHNTIKLFCKRMFLYGKGRGLFIKKHPKAIKLVNIFAIVLIICIFMLPVSYFMQKELFNILVIGFLIYIVAISISTISILYSSRNIRNLVCIPLYFLEHVSFGFGLLSSFVDAKRPA